MLGIQGHLLCALLVIATTSTPVCLVMEPSRTLKDKFGFIFNSCPSFRKKFLESLESQGGQHSIWLMKVFRQTTAKIAIATKSTCLYSSINPLKFTDELLGLFDEPIKKKKSSFSYFLFSLINLNLILFSVRFSLYLQPGLIPGNFVFHFTMFKSLRD